MRQMQTGESSRKANVQKAGMSSLAIGKGKGNPLAGAVIADVFSDPAN